MFAGGGPLNGPHGCENYGDRRAMAANVATEPNQEGNIMSNIQPNRFVLQSSDGKTKVDYETSSFIGKPTLNLTQPPGHPIRHFAGSQIRTLNTEIGTLVSVTTRMTIDTGSTSFSVLIPAITLTAIGDNKSFATEAILTSHSGPDSVPQTGVHEKYQFIPMSGEASFVLSLFEPMLETMAKGGMA
jgi:hypothetical protein